MKQKSKIVILGAGESGVGTAILAKAKNYEVFVSDAGVIQQKYKDVLNQYAINWEEEIHSEPHILDADLVMKSPGIPEQVSIVKKILAKGISVISEIEFAARFTNACIVGITGSNGKTTTASLMHHILKSELSVGLAGNIGDSFAKQVCKEDYANYVLEISSFQLDGIKTFRPHIAVLTNITPDHLDRYEYKFENYIASKFRIVMNQTVDDYFIYDHDDEVIKNWLSQHEIKPKKLPFSLKRELKEGAYLHKQQLILKIDNQTINMPESSLALDGKHNIKNAMAAATVAQLLKIRKQTIRDSMSNFMGVEHRLEEVLKINKVRYINDSKATNVNATFFALESMSHPTVWIVGGVDKGNNYSELYELVNEKVKSIICLGKNNNKIIESFSSIVDSIVETESMEDAVKMAYKLADPGESVLLSPACSSFDLFKNYEDRGMQFKEAVRQL